MTNCSSRANSVCRALQLSPFGERLQFGDVYPATRKAGNLHFTHMQTRYHPATIRGTPQPSFNMPRSHRLG